MNEYKASPSGKKGMCMDKTMFVLLCRKPVLSMLFAVTGNTVPFGKKAHFFPGHNGNNTNVLAMLTNYIMGIPASGIQSFYCGNGTFSTVMNTSKAVASSPSGNAFYKALFYGKDYLVFNTGMLPANRLHEYIQVYNFF